MKSLLLILVYIFVDARRSLEVYAEPAIGVVEPPIIRRNHTILGQNRCTWGPSYWCNSAKTIAECHAEQYCRSHRRYREGDVEPPIIRRNATRLGENPCTWGPSYWCKSEETQKECKAKSWCESHNRGKRSDDKPPIGSDPCTWGPSYWCDNIENQKQCNAQEYCSKHQRAKRSDGRPPIGSDPCTWGPSYWCKSEETQEECGAKSWCESHNRGGE